MERTSFLLLLSPNALLFTSSSSSWSRFSPSRAAANPFAVFNERMRAANFHTTMKNNANSEVL